jgi:hypothetical protein
MKKPRQQLLRTFRESGYDVPDSLFRKYYPPPLALNTDFFDPGISV